MLLARSPRGAYQLIDLIQPQVNQCILQVQQLSQAHFKTKFADCFCRRINNTSICALYPLLYRYFIPSALLSDSLLSAPVIRHFSFWILRCTIISSILTSAILIFRICQFHQHILQIILHLIIYFSDLLAQFDFSPTEFFWAPGPLFSTSLALSFWPVL